MMIGGTSEPPMFFIFILSSEVCEHGLLASSCLDRTSNEGGVYLLAMFSHV